MYIIFLKKAFLGNVFYNETSYSIKRFENQFKIVFIFKYLITIYKFEDVNM